MGQDQYGRDSAVSDDGRLSQLIEAQNKTVSAQRSAVEANKSATLAVRTSVQAQVAATQARTAATNTALLIGNLVAVSRKTAAIARGAERSVANSRSAADAGKEASSRTLIVARGTAEAVAASKVGLVRIERLLSPFETPTLILLAQPNTWLSNPCLAKRNGSVRFSISKSENKGQKQVSDYEGGDWERDSTPGINVWKISIPLKANHNSGLYSYLDLPSKVLNLSIEIDTKTYQLVGVRIKTNNGQQVVIPLIDATLEKVMLMSVTCRFGYCNIVFPHNVIRVP